MKQTGLKRLVVAGGVGAHRHLRARLVQAMDKLGGEAFFPPLDLCTDNGAMIAYAGAEPVKAGLVYFNNTSDAFTVRPRWAQPDVCRPAPDATGLRAAIKLTMAN